MALDPAAKVRKGTRVFVERSVASRKIENREEFDRFLAAHDFQVIDLAKMSIAEQRTTLATAETIMGVFGTDLICAYFAPAGANVIELIWDPAEDPVIGASCYLMGIKHQFVVCDEALGQRRWKKDRDIRVNCDLLRRRLADIAAEN
jgi:capsular polysaccharide biosynthesis protein